jgi:hypothetical protein
MTDRGNDAVRGIRRALSRREHAEELHSSATYDLREWCLVAERAGVPVSRIARETAMPVADVRELLAGGDFRRVALTRGEQSAKGR